MKKIISLIIILVVVAIALTVGNCGGSGSGDGDGGGNGSGSGEGAENTTAGEVSTEDDFNGVVYAITVVESDYFYNNDRVELTDIESMVKATSGEFIVEIKEDKASLKAYNKLVEKLEELGVKYIEK
ncbi:MAG: hypothetical protein IIW92_09420 [Lachnospiraceae bacterium]|nr:hypothetical protein [Lachnospiraceae bacterium]